MENTDFIALIIVNVLVVSFTSAFLLSNQVLKLKANHALCSACNFPDCNNCLITGCSTLNTAVAMYEKPSQYSA